MPWPAWDHGVEGRALRPASPAEGDSARCGAGRGGPAHRARGGTPSPQGRFKYACSARCAAGMRSAHTPHSSGVGGRRWVPGRRDKKKRKEKKGSPSNKELTPHTSHAPHFFFQTSDTRWRRFQGPSARRRLAVSAGRRAREWRARHALAGMGSWGGGSRPPTRDPSRGGQRQVWSREGRSRTPRAWEHALIAGAFQAGMHRALCGLRPRAVRECGARGGRAEVGPGPQGQEKRKEKAQSKRELSPPLIFFSTRASFFTSWRRLQGPSARRGMPLSWRGAGRVSDVLGLAFPVRASEHGQGIAPWGPGPGREGTAHRQVWPLGGTYPSRHARRHHHQAGPGCALPAAHAGGRTSGRDTVRSQRPTVRDWVRNAQKNKAGGALGGSGAIGTPTGTLSLIAWSDR